MCAWLRTLRSVPSGTSCFLGTIKVSTTPPAISHELRVAALLAGFDEADALKPALDFPKGSD